MARRRSFFAALLLGATFLVSGCTDQPTTPQTAVADPSYHLLNDLTKQLLPSPEREATVLERSVPLERDEVVSQVVGRWGGIIRLPRAGLTVTVPWGALDGPTRITVTAPAGDLVGYHFEPHGLEFNRPITAVQDLLKTEGIGLTGMSAAYFEGDLEPTVTTLESLPLWLTRILGIFRVEHFSGYVIAVN